MFKKSNIATNIAAVSIISALTAIGHYKNNDAIMPLIGLIALAWFIIVFCGHRKKKKKKTGNNL